MKIIPIINEITNTFNETFKNNLTVNWKSKFQFNIVPQEFSLT